MSNKRDVVRSTAVATAISSAVVSEVLSKAFEAILDAAERDGVVTIMNFGTFRLKKMKARKGFNPRSGEAVDVPELVRIKFKPAASVLRRLNNEPAADAAEIETEAAE